jgi:hypothetical protein
LQRFKFFFSFPFFFGIEGVDGGMRMMWVGHLKCIYTILYFLNIIVYSMESNITS